MLKIFFPAKIFMHASRIPLPPLAHRFIRQPLDVLEQMQTHHQPNRQPGTSRLAVVQRKMRIQMLPIDQFPPVGRTNSCCRLMMFLNLARNSSCVPLSCGFGLGLIPSPPKIKLQGFGTPYAETLQFPQIKININKSIGKNADLLNF